MPRAQNLERQNIVTFRFQLIPSSAAIELTDAGQRLKRRVHKLWKWNSKQYYNRAAIGHFSETRRVRNEFLAFRYANCFRRGCVFGLNGGDYVFFFGGWRNFLTPHPNKSWKMLIVYGWCNFFPISRCESRCYVAVFLSLGAFSRRVPLGSEVDRKNKLIAISINCETMDKDQVLVSPGRCLSFWTSRIVGCIAMMVRDSGTQCVEVLSYWVIIETTAALFAGLEK